MKEKNIFYLPLSFQTLGLLKSTECFTRPQTVVSHHFIHLSVQHLLAARYIAIQIKPSDQASRIKELIDTPHFGSHHTSVLHFYSSMTKLTVPGICPIIKQVAERCSTHNNESKDKVPSSESKELVLLLISCLYGAQDPLLCKLVSNTLGYKLDLSRVPYVLANTPPSSISPPPTFTPKVLHRYISLVYTPPNCTHEIV